MKFLSASFENILLLMTMDTKKEYDGVTVCSNDVSRMISFFFAEFCDILLIVVF